MKTSPVLIASFAAASLAACSSMQGERSSESPSPSRQAQAGATSAASPQLVRNVQQQLKAKGMNAGPVDGVWGRQTQQAVREFQKKQGLQPTGQLDGATLAALGITGGQQSASAGSGPSASAGASGTTDGGIVAPTFSEADTNKDGAVSREEFDAAFRQAR